MIKNTPEYYYQKPDKLNDYGNFCDLIKINTPTQLSENDSHQNCHAEPWAVQFFAE